MRTSRLSLIAGGDVMLGEHPAMVGRGVATRLRHDPSYDPLAGIAPLLRSADLALANLESAVDDWPRLCLPSRRECRAPAAALRSLADAGFGALTIANNHIQQHGPEAVRHTLDRLAAHGIRAVGLAGEAPGTCRPVDLEIHGVPLRLLGYSLRPRQHFAGRPLYAEGTSEGMLADIVAGRAAGRVMVVTVHWGDEFVARPSHEQIALGRAMIDAGSALVIGHHPHVLQGWERHGRGAIFYSLGNLVFDMPWLPELRCTALCECTLSEAGCEEIELRPLVLDADHRPHPAAGMEGEEILTFLEAERRRLEGAPEEAAEPDPETYRELVAAAAARERWARNHHFLRNLWRYRPDVAGQLIGKFLLRRVGLLHD